MVLKLKFAAVAAISLLSLSFEAAPAAAGGFWENGCCGGAVIVQPAPIYPSCSCGTANYGLSYSSGYGGGYGPAYYGGYGPGYPGGYDGGYGPGYPGGYDGGYGPGYPGGYRGGLYRRAAFSGYRGGLYRRGAYRGYRGGLNRRGY
jgi:hypothetical protein